MFLAGIFILHLLAALYFAKAVAAPILLAFVLYLLLQPAQRVLARLHLPKMAGAVLIVVLLYGSIGLFVTALSGPATRWVERMPESIVRMESRIAPIKQAMAKFTRATSQVEKITETAAPGPAPVVIKAPGLGSILFSGTRDLVFALLTLTVLLFFLLLSGDLFLRRMVELAPRLSDKKQVVDIVREVERSVSGYLLTVTMMNAAVGVTTCIGAWLAGLGDPVLWGALAFLLNYIPIIGPIVAVAIIFMAGVVQFDAILPALLPAGIYFVIHLVEAEWATPMLLAKRFLLNPVLVIVSIVFWYWMWGVPGVLLAVPVLAIIKIVCDRIASLSGIGHFLGGEATGEGL